MEREQGKNKAEIGEKAEVSLRDLIKSEVKRRKHTPGMRVSERVIWLSEAIESVEFWDSLDNLIEKDKSKRQSLGGIFTRELGKEKVGPYTFKDCFNSLDVFLKPFGYRATEFIFRDFVPGKRAIRDKIEEVRHKAFDKYPRVRRLYWKDYQDLLNGSLFWRNIVLDLQEITRPVSYENFSVGQMTLKITEKLT